MSTGQVIGTVTFTEPFEVTDNSYPTACNYRLVQVTPGTYDAVFDPSAGGSVYVTVDGTQTYQHLVNRLFTATSLQTSDEHKPTTHTFSMYAYAAAKAAAEDEPKLFGGAFRLAEGWGVTVRHVTLTLTEDEQPKHHTSRGFAKLPAPAGSW